MRHGSGMYYVSNGKKMGVSVKNLLVSKLALDIQRSFKLNSTSGLVHRLTSYTLMWLPNLMRKKTCEGMFKETRFIHNSLVCNRT